MNLMPFSNFNKQVLGFANKRLLIALFVVLIILIPFLAFNYNNIQKLFTKNKPAPLTDKSIKYQCPSVKAFCEKGKDLIKNGAYLGFAGDLASKSAILATFDGKITSSITILPDNLKKEKLITIYLDNIEKNLRAIYYFKGDGTGLKTVKKGDQIGRSLYKINAYETYLIFQIIKGDPVKGEKIKLSAKDFE